MADSLAGHRYPNPTPQPPRLSVYQPPTSEIWVATLPNWRRRFAIAGAVVVSLIIVGYLVS